MVPTTCTFVKNCAAASSSQWFIKLSQRLLKHNKQIIHSSYYSASTTISKSINLNSALRILNLENNPNYTSFALRDAYFAAAKLCHPDSKTNKFDDDDECTEQFWKVTEAYEFLKQSTRRDMKSSNNNKHGPDDKSSFLIKSEEENYRNACRDYLGLDAETVEESKRCPLFREWLKGKTDAAYHWNRFFMVNGGLAPMLNGEKIFKLAEGSSHVGNNGLKRRRRRQ